MAGTIMRIIGHGEVVASGIVERVTTVIGKTANPFPYLTFHLGVNHAIAAISDWMAANIYDVGKFGSGVGADRRNEHKHNYHGPHGRIPLKNGSLAANSNVRL